MKRFTDEVGRQMWSAGDDSVLNRSRLMEACRVWVWVWGLGLGFSAPRPPSPDFSDSDQAVIAGVNGGMGGGVLMMGFSLGSEGGAADALGVCAGL